MANGMPKALYWRRCKTCGLPHLQLLDDSDDDEPEVDESQVGDAEVKSPVKTKKRKNEEPDPPRRRLTRAEANRLRASDPWKWIYIPPPQSDSD